MDQRNEPSTSQNENNLCAFCKNTAITRCTGCLQVYYCDVEHQKLDWKIHAKNCSVLKLVKDTSGQQYYVATRNIKVGKVVYEEKQPIVLGPVPHLTPSCPSCYVRLTKKTAIPCKKCGLPLCRNCKTHGPECEFATEIMEKKISIPDFENFNMSSFETIFARSLALKTTNPSAYNKLLELRVQTDIPSAFFEEMQSLLEFTSEQCHQIGNEILQNMPAVICHGHMILMEKGCASAVYEKVRYFKHDCQPNCTKIISDIGGIAIKAMTPISKGENITICYIDPTGHAMKRRQALGYNFIKCQCKRCEDPTEFGTMYNSVKCIKRDCDGYMLPPSFIVNNYNDNLPDFVCDKCSAKVPQITIMNTLTQLVKERDSTLKADESSDVSQFIKTLEKQRKILHKGHGQIVEVKISIVNGISNIDSFQHISNELLIEYMKYSKEVIEIVNLLIPSEIILRGAFRFELLRMSREYLKRNERKNSPMQNQKFLEDLIKTALESDDLLSNELLSYCRSNTEDINKTEKIIDRLISNNFRLCVY